MNKKSTQMGFVFLFCIVGLLSACVAWPLLGELGFLVAGILLNVLAVTYWFRVVRVDNQKNGQST
jgi:hypothetical protein